MALLQPLIIHDAFLAGDVAREPHLVPRRVVVHRPISEMNKQITGSGFISLLSSLVCLPLGLPKLENGSLPSNPQPLYSDQKDFGVGWVILITIHPLPSIRYLKTYSGLGI